MIDQQYNPNTIEHKWYEFWEKNGYFDPNQHSDKNYCIHMPPPNVTGTLHMGHGFQHTLQDILIRYHRMMGYKVLWQPGTDHAGIATQIVVERLLESRGIDIKSLSREEFIEHVWSWQRASGGIITEQMRRLGDSCSWKHEQFTMNDELSQIVIDAFIKLYNDGYIYRDYRLVNWDIKLQTALSDLEVVSVEEDGHLWHIKYILDNDGAVDEHIVVATTRPETIFGDVAIAVNPTDTRYSHLVGTKVIVPFTERVIPIILDGDVNVDFGTGCVKITPAHDFNDYATAKRHELEPIVTFTFDGKLNSNVPIQYQGLDIQTARDAIVRDLQFNGLLSNTLPHKLAIPRSDRTQVVIQPMLTHQWFMHMDKFAKYALEVVSNKSVQFIPDNWTLTYCHWLSNIQPWCISRQLLWGHRIPAFYDVNNPNAAPIIAATLEQAKLNPNYREDMCLVQDNDVLDTWFSSALWCFSTLAHDKNFTTSFLPSNVLVTGFDIIFFWVARMIMLTHYFTGKLPFQKVYITGLIQDAHGNKMSKSKGNIIDPIDLIDGISADKLVEKRVFGLMNPNHAEMVAKQTMKDYPDGFKAFGADALRFTFALIATSEREIRFDFSKLESSHRFCNKLWNTAKFILIYFDKLNIEDVTYDINSLTADKLFMQCWIMGKFEQLIVDMHALIKLYRFDLVAHKLYEFIWYDYCAWYLEWIKVDFNDHASHTYLAFAVLFDIFDGILRMLHSIMPFITEELWQVVVRPRVDCEASIMVAKYPIPKGFCNKFSEFDLVIKIIDKVRVMRADLKLKPNALVGIYLCKLNNEQQDLVLRVKQNILQLAKVDTLKFLDNLPESNLPIAVLALDIYLMLEVQETLEQRQVRIASEMNKLQLQLDKINQRMSHYTTATPQHIVDKDKDHQTQLLQALSSLKQSV